MSKIIIVMLILIKLTGLSIAYAANDKAAIAEISMVIFAEIKGRNRLKIHDKIYLNDRLIVQPSGIVRLRLPDAKEIELLEGDHQLIQEIDPSNKKQYLVLITEKKREQKQTITAIQKGDSSDQTESQIDNGDGQANAEDAIEPQSSDDASSDDNETADNNQDDGNETPDIPFDQPVCLVNCGHVQTTLDPQQHPVDRTQFRIGTMTQKGFVLMPFERSHVGVSGTVMGAGVSAVPGAVMVPGQTGASGRIMTPGVAVGTGDVRMPGQTGSPGRVMAPGIVGVPGKVMVPGSSNAPSRVMLPGIVGGAGRTMVPSNVSVPKAIIPQGNRLRIEQNFSAGQNR